MEVGLSAGQSDKETSFFLQVGKNYTVCGYSMYNNAFGADGSVRLLLGSTGEELMSFVSSQAVPATMDMGYDEFTPANATVRAPRWYRIPSATSASQPRLRARTALTHRAGATLSPPARISVTPGTSAARAHGPTALPE